MDREYELFYIVRPDIDEDQVRTVMDEVASLIAGHGGEMTKSSLWGRRRLAYPIGGFNDGYYALKELTLPADKVRELERQLRLDERVIRQLISLKQVYYLPGDEDRRGRVRTRGKDRGEVAEGALPESAKPTDDETAELADDALEAEVAKDDGFRDAADEAVEVAETADDEDGEE
ncbi:MAG TPA: 30S ribosomal protein S6 [Candidatus Acidoferrales bacterium]|nr:30S ribosomal protein S6 [Candidatus Acidoferrales bacterium]